MALKLTLKNGSIHKVFKSQEPSLPVLSLDPFPFFILFYGLIICISNKITKPFCGYGKYRDILKRNDKHAPCNCSHAPQCSFQHICGLLHLPKIGSKTWAVTKVNTGPGFEETQSFIRPLCISKTSKEAMPISHATRPPVKYQKWSRSI